MTISETIARYGGKPIRLTLDDAQYEVFKRLLRITKEYADHEADAWGHDHQPREHRNAIYHLTDVLTAFDHYDVHRDKPLLIPGDAAIFLTRGKHMASMPNMEFMRTPAAKAIITTLITELGIPHGIVVDGQ